MNIPININNTQQEQTFFPVDIIVPLAYNKQKDYESLRFCLRSIDKFAKDVRDIYVVGPDRPEWLRGVIFHELDDPHKQNKDANLIDKVLKTVKDYGITHFLFWSDDQVILQPCHLSTLPPIYNPRGYAQFNRPQANRWQKRVMNTFDFLKSKGIELPYNYESHTPQLYNGQSLLQIMQGIDYAKLPGYSINTLFMGLLGVTGGLRQGMIKATEEGAKTENLEFSPHTLFYGFDDKGFELSAKERLSELFKEPCRFEIS